MLPLPRAGMGGPGCDRAKSAGPAAGGTGQAQRPAVSSHPLSASEPSQGPGETCPLGGTGVGTRRETADKELWGLSAPVSFPALVLKWQKLRTAAPRAASIPPGVPMGTRVSQLLAGASGIAALAEDKVPSSPPSQCKPFPWPSLSPAPPPSKPHFSQSLPSSGPTVGTRPWSTHELPNSSSAPSNTTHPQHPERKTLPLPPSHPPCLSTQSAEPVHWPGALLPLEGPQRLFPGFVFYQSPGTASSPSGKPARRKVAAER